MCFILLIYHSLKLVESKKIINFVGLRPIIAPYPLFYLIYLLMKKINIKILLKGFSLSLVIIVIALLPWVVRNYKVYNTFIHRKVLFRDGYFKFRKYCKI